jgi:hypothetical protein
LAGQKRTISELKDHVLRRLVELSQLTHCGYVQSRIGILSVLRGSGYCFHQRYSGADVQLDKDQIPLIERVESKPKERSKMRLCDAWATIEAFLAAQNRLAG